MEMDITEDLLRLHFVGLFSLVFIL